MRYLVCILLLMTAAAGVARATPDVEVLAVIAPPEALGTGQRYAVDPGQTVPVDSRLEPGSAEFSLASINGESAPRVFHAGQRRPPGAQELTLIFKRKKLIWDDGNRLQPVNLPSDHPWRRLFSLRVMKSLPEAQAQYWNSMYYHGIYPPHVVASGEAMLRYVSETRGALGYIGACDVDARVKPVLWLLPSGQVSETPPELHCPP